MMLLQRWPVTASAMGPVLIGLLSGGLMLLGGPPLLVMAVGGVVAAVAIVAKPVRGLLLFCLLAPFVPWSTVTVGIRVTLSEALLALTWVGVFWQRLTGRLPPWRKGDTERRMLWLMAWTVVPFLAGQFMVQAEGNGPVNWLRWLLNVSTLFLVPILTQTKALQRRMMDCLVIGFAALLLLSLGMFIRSPDARAMIPVLSSLHYAHPEALEDIFSAMYNRMALPWVHPNSTGGALLSLGALIVWLAYRRVPQAGSTLLIGGLLAATMLVAYPPAHERLMSLFGGSQDASTGIRFEEYAHFHLAVARYPLGLGFKAETPATGAGVYGISNLWLNYWYKLGLPGMLLFIALNRAWWREVRDLGDLSKMNKDNALRVGSVGAVMAALLTGFIDHYFSFTQVLIALFWMTMAISLQASRPSPSTS